MSNSVARVSTSSVMVVHSSVALRVLVVFLTFLGFPWAGCHYDAEQGYWDIRPLPDLAAREPIRGTWAGFRERWKARAAYAWEQR